MMLNLIVKTTAEPVTQKTVLNITTSNHLDLKELHFLSLFFADDRHTAMIKGKNKSKSVTSGGLAYDEEKSPVDSAIDPEIGNGAEDGPVNNDSGAFKEIELG
jgi:hypothetical protein